jgi:hypothetical protein
MNLTAFTLDVVGCLNESLQWNVNKEFCNCEKYQFSFENYSSFFVDIANVLLLLSL